MEIALKSVVIVNKTKQFAMVYGFGECVGEIKIRFFNGSEIDIQPKDVKVITPELALTCGDMFDFIKGISSHYSNSQLGESAHQLIKKATGAN